ncbi:hypothetical protein [Azospirillum soli]|uniref:hypothetical protein n=1 Tax=Azospirillum soli TaxID=1304799 RepID=UPI001AEA7827|nr:hypothetical protein [Azospirillum soli]MBP2311442.1 hypothetical protein [Azospirillum soli]
MRRVPARPLALGLLLLAAAWSPAQAQAPTVDANGAKALASVLKDGLARWFPAPAEDSEAPLVTWEGEPVVTPTGAHYTVALPKLSVEDAEGTVIEVGTVLMTVAPQEGGTFAVTATLPERMKILNADEEGEDYVEAATLAIGRQHFKGVWSSAFETLLTVDAAYGDLALTATDGQGAISVGSVTLMQEMKPDGATTWSGPGALAISNLSMKDETKRDIFTLAGLAVENTVSRADLTRITELQKLSQRHTAAGTTPTVAELLPALRGIVGGGSFRVRLSGLTGQNPEDGTKVALGQLAIRGGMEDLDQAQSTASLAVEAREFGITPNPAPSAFMPQRLDVQLSLAKLPNAALWQGFADLAAITEAEQKAKEAAPVKKAKAGDKKALEAAGNPSDAVFQRISAALTEAGSELRLDKLDIDTPVATGSATGSARYVPNAAFGAVGGATILLRGLDAAAKALQPKAGQKADKETQDALGMLAMLQAMGQVSQDEAGADVRTYKIDVNETGQMLLNGADMSAMMGGGAAEEPAPKKGGKKN